MAKETTAAPDAKPDEKAPDPTPAKRMLADGDLSMMRFAAGERRAIDGFINRYIQGTYELRGTDTIDMNTGEIKTLVPPAPPAQPSPDKKDEPVKAEVKP